MKICTKCGVNKEINEFTYVKNRSSYKARCKKCTNEYSQSHYLKNKKIYNERRKNYYSENKEKELERCKNYYYENFERISKREKKKNEDPVRKEKTNKRGRDWAKENPKKHAANATKHKIRYPQKHQARLSVMWAIKLGFLKRPERCEVCKRLIKVEAHHMDYEKPLEVKWLCRICHNKEHGKMLHIKIEGDYGAG